MVLSLLCSTIESSESSAIVDHVEVKNGIHGKKSAEQSIQETEVVFHGTGFRPARLSTTQYRLLF